MKKKNSLLRYHGGKHKIADWIISHFPPHSCYVEPFGGGASVLIAKKTAKTEVYNDLDSEVFNVFKTIRNHSEALAEKLSFTLFSRDELRLSFEPTDCQIEAARRFIVRSHQAFSTASNNKNVGFRAAINSGDYCSMPLSFSKIPAVVLDVRARFNRVILENCDAMSLFDRYDFPETLWFLDPPYLNSTRSAKSISDGYSHNMTDVDHVKICQKIRELKGKVVLCGYDNHIYDTELPGWEKSYRKTYAQSQRKTTEVLWMNFKTLTLF